MIRSVVSGAKTLAILAAIVVSVGSIGKYLNLQNPFWNSIGVNPTEIYQVVDGFPKTYCPESVQTVCVKLSDGVLWFLGLDH